MKCPRCGYQEDDNAAVCSRCGNVLRAGGDILSEEEAEEAQAKRAGSAKRGAIIGGIALVVVVVGGFFSYKAIVGPPTQVVGNWTNSGYGGLLALLSGGIKVEITSESASGQIAGKFVYNTYTEPITKGKVTGKHISLTAKPSASYPEEYWTLSGSYSPSTQAISGVIETYNTSVTPPTKKGQTVTLTKASTTG